MRILKQELYFPILIGIHFVMWAIDLYLYTGDFMEVSSDTLFFGEMTNESWANVHRILGEVFSSWVVTVFAANFLMATRARWVEKVFGGLDKMYLIHRRSGVIAVFLLIAHFIVVPRDLTAFNVGKPLGFWALVLILIGVVLSAAPVFKKKIPYHKWINIHKLMGVFYVMAVAHAFIVHSLIQELPLTRTYVFGMAFIGVGSWVYRAFLYGLFNKKLSYTITGLSDLGNGVTEIWMCPDTDKLKYTAGQFAFFSFQNYSPKEQHPFTISSHPNMDDIRITVKDLGDYTHELGGKVKQGDSVKIEGPFGHFSTKYAKEKEQVWIAGGIGITPFLSLAKDIYLNKVHLVWCVKNKQEAVYLKELEGFAKNNPNFNYTIWESENQGYLTAEKLAIKSYSDKAYFVCGPEPLKEGVINQLKDKGVNREDIYDEEFAFR